MYYIICNVYYIIYVCIYITDILTECSRYVMQLIAEKIISTNIAYKPHRI